MRHQVSQVGGDSHGFHNRQEAPHDHNSWAESPAPRNLIQLVYAGRVHDVYDVAELFKLNQQTVRNWIDRGELRAVRVGPRRVRIRRSDLDAFIGASTTKGPSVPEAGWLKQNPRVQKRHLPSFARS